MSRSHETIIDIKATPEEVFRAVTDPAQIVKWFAPEARVDPRVGGEYFISAGPGMEGTAIISAWDPYTHFGGYTERSFAYSSKGGPVEAGTTERIFVDYYIEAMADGVTRLHLESCCFGRSPK